MSEKVYFGGITSDDIDNFCRKPKTLLTELPDELKELFIVVPEISSEMAKLYIERKNAEFMAYNASIEASYTKIMEKITEANFGKYLEPVKNALARIKDNDNDDGYCYFKDDIGKGYAGDVDSHNDEYYSSMNPGVNFDTWKLKDFICSTEEWHLLYNWCEFTENTKTNEILHVLFALKALGFDVLVYKFEAYRRGYDYVEFNLTRKGAQFYLDNDRAGKYELTTKDKISPEFKEYFYNNEDEYFSVFVRRGKSE
jgi:hypothetical protein